MNDSPRVFISYSHGTEEHNDKVLGLAAQLRKDGIDALVDRYIEAPAEGWPRWVSNELEAADFVLCICSSTYRISFEGKNIDGVGLGVNSEGFYIMQDLYDHGERTEKYIPILLERWGNRSIVPNAFRAFKSYFFPEEYEDLYRRLTRQPLHIKPTLGELKKLEPRGNFPKTSAALPVRSNGFEEQPAITNYIKPESYSLDRLAPGDGIFLSRIINPQIRLESETVTTVWIACKGPLQYTIDSVRIKDHATHGLGPVPVVTIPPDAEYRFNYKEGSDCQHALVPALSIGPATRNYASFNISTAPEGAFYHVGELSIWIQYHASDGRMGTLELSAPSETGLKLARLLQKKVHITPFDSREDIQWGEQVVSPEGLQCGVEPQHKEPIYFTPMHFPSWDVYEPPNREALLRARSTCNVILDSRAALHKELEQENHVITLRDWLQEGTREAADLLGGIAGEKSTELIQVILKVDPLQYNAMFALCVRHLVKGDGLLGEHVIKNKDAFQATSILTLVKSTLVLKPVTQWLSILHMKNPANALYGLTPIAHLLKDDLKNEDTDHTLYNESGPFEEEVFVRGTMNNWKTLPPNNARLNYIGNGYYQARLELNAGKHEFKISGASWNSFANAGAMNEGQIIELNQAFRMHRNQLSKNICLELSNQDTGTYIFTIDANNLFEPVVTVTRDR